MVLYCNVVPNTHLCLFICTNLVHQIYKEKNSINHGDVRACACLQFAAQAARRHGVVWTNVFDRGPRRNWQETFDVRGRLWWLRWMLPAWGPKQGCGYAVPMTEHCLLMSTEV